MANFITVLLRPKYEQPNDTAQEVLDRGMIPVGLGHYREVLLNSPSPVYQQLGKKFIMPNNIDKILKEDVLGKDTHVLMGLLYPYQKQFGKFHTSKEYLWRCSSLFCKYYE